MSRQRRKGQETARVSILLGLLLPLLLFAADAAQAPQQDDPGEGSPGHCPHRATVHAVLTQEGLPLLGSELRIQATNASIVVVDPTCDPTSYPLPAGAWAWELVTRPSGSGASLSGGSTLEVRLTPDVVGDYVVRFTACAGGCDLPGALPNAPQAIRQVTVSATDRIVFPPETEPASPAQAATSPTAVRDQCPTFADFLNAAWLTVESWRGPDDYELLEGAVSESRVSSADNNSNHESMDVNVFVRPDPPFRRILGTGQDTVEFEWERDHFPELFRSTRGDRASLIGYWIYDCGHDNRTEIHPPVLVAAHRPRAIAIPPSAGYGTNVHVPGIVTELWINSDAGEITGNCSRTGLHEQGGGGGADLGPHECLPQTKGFDRSPINRVYQFNILLPRSPQGILAAAGLDRPAVPLYIEVANPLSSGGPEPDVQPVNEGGVTFLRVRLDLSSYSARSYSRRILSGWAYAAPDNWGLRRWKVRIRSLDVHDDGDGLFGGDGDWRFWIITNNATQEWTKLYDCDGCVHGLEQFGGVPWETGSASANRSLGPDLLLFPGQEIYLQTAGFENDVNYEDSIGKVSELLPQEPIEASARSFGGDAEYTLSYQVLEGSPVGNASLSPSAQQLYDAYVITSQSGGVVSKFPGRLRRAWNHPLLAGFQRGQQPVRWRDSEFFETEDTESVLAPWIAAALLLLVCSILLLAFRRLRRR